MMPDGVARPNAAVAWSTSPQLQPPLDAHRAARRVDVDAAHRGRSMTSASSHTPRPPVVAATADGDLERLLRGRSAIAAMTSAASRQRAIAAGCRSIMAL